MDLMRISKNDVLDAMRRNGTRKAKIDAVADKLTANTRYYQDDVLTLIVSGGSFGWAKRHVTNGLDAKELAEWVAGTVTCEERLMEMEGRAERLLTACDVPDADRGMAIAACRLLV